MNRQPLLLLAIAQLALAAAAGCTEPAAEPSAPRGEAPAPAATTGSAGATAPEPPPVALRSVDRAQYDEAVKQLVGKVVLVDFWATWCGPCLAQLPHANELAHEHGAEALAVVTVSMDEPESASRAGKVVAAKADAATLHLISALGGGPAAVEAFEIQGGSVPHYKLYDRAGKLRRTFGIDPAAERQFTPQDIDAAVAELLAESSP